MFGSQPGYSLANSTAAPASRPTAAICSRVVASRLSSELRLSAPTTMRARLPESIASVEMVATLFEVCTRPATRVCISSTPCGSAVSAHSSVCVSSTESAVPALSPPTASTVMTAPGSADSCATVSRNTAAAFFNASIVPFEPASTTLASRARALRLLPPAIVTIRRSLSPARASARTNTLMALPRFS